MKPLFPSFSRASVLALFFLTSFFSHAQCIDTSLIDLTAICTSIYDPVCGCDGVTYSNACVAEKTGGVTSYTSGPCSSSSVCSVTADFSMSVSGLTVNFTDASVTAATITDWDWTFGDGGTSTLANPSHTYSTAGTYTVCLDVKAVDSLGDSCTDRSCRTIIVSGSTATCAADFSYVADTSKCSVDFTDASTSSGTIVSWAWTFGDGGSSTMASPVHTYTSPGTYYACLTITTSDTCTSTFCDSVRVCVPTPVSCDADFTSEVDSADSCLWRFNDASTATGTITSYSWTFGDGGTATGLATSHAYGNSGPFVVCLTISTDDSCTDTECDTIMVMGCDTTADTTSHINNLEKSADWSLFPNPLDGDQLQISLTLEEAEIVEINLFDVTGKRLRNVYPSSLTAGQHKVTIDELGDLAKGLYVVHLRLGTEVTHKTFVKQ